MMAEATKLYFWLNLFIAGPCGLNALLPSTRNNKTGEKKTDGFTELYINSNTCKQRAAGGNATHLKLKRKQWDESSSCSVCAGPITRQPSPYLLTFFYPPFSSKLDALLIVLTIWENTFYFGLWINSVIFLSFVSFFLSSSPSYCSKWIVLLNKFAKVWNY